MALFDFLKRKRKQEKEEAKTEKRAEPERAEKKVEKKSDVRAMPADNFALLTPHVTERARMAAEGGHYTFRVKPTATKRQIRDSVERFYNVHVTGVQIVKVHEKPRRRGLTEGVKKGYKKAVVALREGEAIDIF
jgi:large subunit ribosomal protein L23